MAAEPPAVLEPLCVVWVSNTAMSPVLRGSADGGVQLPAIRGRPPMSGIRRVDDGETAKTTVTRFALCRPDDRLCAARSMRHLQHDLAGDAIPLLCLEGFAAALQRVHLAISGPSSPADRRRLRERRPVGLDDEEEEAPPTAGPPRAGNHGDERPRASQEPQAPVSYRA